jgi:hypothetical protein
VGVEAAVAAAGVEAAEVEEAEAGAEGVEAAVAEVQQEEEAVAPRAAACSSQAAWDAGFAPAERRFEWWLRSS